MNKAATIARVLLGLAFVIFSLNFWLNFIKIPPLPGNAGTFVGLMYVSGYLAFVKVIELLGGLAALAGRTTLALLLLGPVVLNILLIDVYLAHAFDPVAFFLGLLVLFLAWTERARFAAFLK